MNAELKLKQILPQCFNTQPTVEDIAITILRAVIPELLEQDGTGKRTKFIIPLVIFRSLI